MSCKRNHKARSLGCHVGPVRLRGCSRGCCPYPDSQIEANERIDYSTQDYSRNTVTITSTVDYTLSPNGHHQCQSPYRPKFVCVPCRRAFKAAVVEGNQYSIWEDSSRPGWWFAPEGWYSRALSIEWNNLQKDQARYEKVDADVRAYHLGTKQFTQEEVEEMRRCHPDAWWQPLNSSRVRCPSCAEPGMAVGNKFEAPSKMDAKAWGRVGERLDKGERFTFCMSREEEQSLIYGQEEE